MNVSQVYLALQNIPRRTVLTLGNNVVLYYTVNMIVSITAREKCKLIKAADKS